MREVLILDDEIIAAMGLKSEIEKSGEFTILLAANIDEALALYRTHSPEIGIIDINLNEENTGIDFVKTVNGMEKVIFLSGYSEALYLEDLKNISYDLFLEKPIDTNVLLAHLMSK
ncbi:MAG: response regulator transcription factor [Spirochaetia bacterium]